MIAALSPGTETGDDGRRVWTREERFCATTYQMTTGRDWDQLLASGAKVVVDSTDTGTVMGWGFSRNEGRPPYVFVCRPWKGTQVGEAIRDRLLRELGT